MKKGEFAISDRTETCKHKAGVYILLIAILLVSWVSSSFPVLATSIQARGDISGRAVTSLTVTPDQISDGGNVKVRIEFDETGVDIQSGDTITVLWSKAIQGNAYLAGYVKTIPLNIQGRHVGDAVIANDKATITFNESINNLDGVQGWVEFELQGRNITNTSNEDTKIVTITSGGKYTEVQITKPTSGTEGVFYYKTGSMSPRDTEHVQWFLQINTEKKMLKSKYIFQILFKAGRS